MSGDARALLEARAWLDARRPAQALERLRPEITSRPDDPDVLALMAETLQASGQPDQALEYADRAAAAAPTDRHVLAVRLSVLLALRRYPEATTIADVLVASDPGDPAGHHVRAVVDIEAGCVDARTEHHARTALALDPDDLDHHVVFGVVREELGDLTTAGQAYRHVVTGRPTDTDARVGLARVAAATGHAAEFVDHLAAVGRADPTSAVAPMSLVAAVLLVFRRVPLVLALVCVLSFEPRVTALTDPHHVPGATALSTVVCTVILAMVVAVGWRRAGPSGRRLAREGVRSLPLVRRLLLGQATAVTALWVSAAPMPPGVALGVFAAGVVVGAVIVVSAVARGRRSASGWLAGSRFEATGP